MALLCSGATILCNPRLATLPSTVILVFTFSQNLGSMIEEDGLAYMLIFCIAIFHVAKRFRRECTRLVVFPLFFIMTLHSSETKLCLPRFVCSQLLVAETIFLSFLKITIDLIFAKFQFYYAIGLLECICFPLDNFPVFNFLRVLYLHGKHMNLITIYDTIIYECINYFCFNLIAL